MHPDSIPNRLRTVAALAVSILALGGVACDDDATTSSTTGGDGGGGGEAGLPTSPEPTVRFKSGERLRREVARGLELDPGSLCLELGQFDCVGIHAVVLGESDAFGSSLYEPLPATTATTPLAVERVVLAACSQRATLDLALPEAAVMFRDLDVDADGKLVDIESPAVAAAIDEVYRRGLGRRATDAEVTAHKSLYATVADKSATAAKDWAALSCFSALTTMEALFY